MKRINVMAMNLVELVTMVVQNAPEYGIETSVQQIINMIESLKAKERNDVIDCIIKIMDDAPEEISSPLYNLIMDQKALYI